MWHWYPVAFFCLTEDNRCHTIPGGRKCGDFMEVFMGQSSKIRVSMRFNEI